MPWAAIAFGSASLLSLPTLMTEWRIKRLEEVISSNDQAAIAEAEVTDPERSNAREAFLSAQILARRAVLLSLDERKPVLDQAEALLDSADAQRPRWGQSYMIRAYVTGLAVNQVNGESDRWIGRSYDASPVLYPEGAWRVVYGAAAWPTLDSMMRRSVIREAVVIMMIGGTPRRSVDEAMKTSAANIEFRQILSQEWGSSKVRIQR